MYVDMLAAAKLLRRESAMRDLFVMAISAAFAAACWLLLVLCDRLMGDN